MSTRTLQVSRADFFAIFERNRSKLGAFEAQGYARRFPLDKSLVLESVCRFFRFEIGARSVRGRRVRTARTPAKSWARLNCWSLLWSVLVPRWGFEALFVVVVKRKIENARWGSRYWSWYCFGIAMVVGVSEKTGRLVCLLLFVVDGVCDGGNVDWFKKCISVLSIEILNINLIKYEARRFR